MKLVALLATHSQDRTRATYVGGAPMPYDEALAIFKEAVKNREIPADAKKADCHVLEIWSNQGRLKVHSFNFEPIRTPEPAPAPVAPEVTETAAPAASAPETPAPVESDSGKDPVLAFAAKFEAGETVTAEELETGLTAEQLKALAARYEIAVPASAKTKADIAQVILADEGEEAAAE